MHGRYQKSSNILTDTISTIITVFLNNPDQSSASPFFFSKAKRLSFYLIFFILNLARQHAMHSESDTDLAIPPVRQCQYCVWMNAYIIIPCLNKCIYIVTLLWWSAVDIILVFFESHCHYIIPRGTSIPTCWWHGWWISWGRAKRRDSGMKTWIKVNSKTPQGGVGLLKLYGKNWHRPVSMVTGLSSLCNFQHKGSEGKELSVNDTVTPEMTVRSSRRRWSRE